MELLAERGAAGSYDDHPRDCALERFPITWNLVIEKEALRIKELEHVLMRHRIYISDV